MGDTMCVTRSNSGEWCKHTNFELATRAPMMIRVPGVTDISGTGAPLRTNAFTEHVDLFPTLTELAVGVVLPQCPEGPAQLTTALCTMGKSLVPLLHAVAGAPLTAAGAPAAQVYADAAASYNASYMQYPRQAGRNPRPKPAAPLATENLLENTDGGSEHSIRVLPGRQPATFYLC